MVVPQIRWLDQIGGPEEEQTEGVTVSSGQERLFATGFTFGTFGDNSNTPGSGFDVWVASYDLGGNLQDSVQLNSEAEGAVPDDFARAVTFDPAAGSSGLLYVVGETFGDITNNPDRAINTGSSDGFVSLYQPTENGLGGSPIASFQFDIGDNGRRDFVSDVALDSNGNVYVVGNTQQGNNGFDAYVAKFTAETLRNFDTTTPGEEQAEWIELFSTSGRDEAEAVGISDGELFVTGSTTGNIDADGEETNDSNIWLARISDLENASDSSITVNELESPGEDEAFDLALSGGDIYLTGSTRGFLDSQDDPANDPDGNLGRRDAWVAKFDGETFSETATPNWIEQFGSSTDDFARGITAFSTVNEGRVEETTISVTGYTDGNLNDASNQGSLDAWVVELIDDRPEDAVSLPNEAPTLSQAPIFGEGGIVLDTIVSRSLSSGEVVGTANAMDRQQDEITYELLSEGSNLNINAETGQLSLTNPDLDDSLEFVVQARDDAQPRNTNQVNVILPVNQNAPPIISDSTFNDVSETPGPLGGVVANFADPDNSNNFSFRIVGGNSDINNAPLLSDQTLILDEFNDNSNIGTVNAADPEGESFTFTIASGAQGNEFGGTTLNDDQTEITFENDDGETVTFAINQDTEAITLSSISNGISVAELAALDNNFQLTIQADDGSEDNTGEIEIDIVDNPPEFSQEQGFSLDVVDVATANNEDFVGNVSASDPSGENVTYEITSGNDPDGDNIDAFTIRNNGEIRVNEVNELNSSFTLTVAASDSANTSETEVVIPVEINQAINNDPVITDSTFNVDFTAGGEIPDEIGTLNFGDPENDPLSFTIINGNTTGVFGITDNGLLTVEDDTQISAGDPFNLVVQVDDGNATDTGSVQIDFADNPPEFAESGFSFSPINPGVVENGDVLGTVTAEDPEGTAVSYSIVDGTPFTIDSESGVITLNNREELGGSAELIVEAEDENGNTSEVPILIPVDEKGFSIDNDGQITLRATENVPSQANLTVEVSDGVDTDEGELTLNFDPPNPDAPVFQRQGGFVFNTLRPETASDLEDEVVGTVATNSNGDTFAIVGGNDPDGNETDAFEIDADSGEISLLDAEELTENENYELTVEADNGNQTTQTAVIIPVNTANDAPLIDETDFVSENVATNSIAGIVEAVDPDGDDLDFTLAGAGDQLAIDEDGVITITSDADFALGDSIDFEVTVTDEVEESDTAEISLNFRDLVELDPEAGTQIVGSEDADFARDITSDRGGNIFIGGETAGVLSSAEPPIVVDGFAQSDTITLRFNKPLDESAGPARSDFEVLVNTVINNQTVELAEEVAVTEVEIDGQSVILSLAQGVTLDDVVGVIYEDPSDFDDENAIQDRFGNDSLDIARQVTNLTGTGENIPELPADENEEENAGALDVWLSRLGDNDPSPAAGTTENTEPPQPTQSVFTDIDEVTAQTPIFQNTSFDFNVNYSAIDAEGNDAFDLSGLGLRMHFDSNALDLENINLEDNVRTPATRSVNLPNDIQPDTNNFDGDGSTDSFVLLSWSDVAESWPGEPEQDNTDEPIKLFDASFTTARDFAGDVDSAINFTSSSTADGFSFASSDPVIAPEKYTYDVDDNGEVDALTDGLQILNFLFDNNRSALDGAIASNANRDAEEITDYLNLAANSSAFDVDGNNSEDALTDGILIARFMFGFRGDSLTSGVIDPSDTDLDRPSSEDIEGYIQDFLPG